MGRSRCILQRFGQRREVLRSIRSIADSYTYAYGKSESYCHFDGNAQHNPKHNPNGDSYCNTDMHGQMHAYP
jgi:hypothetical protein